MNTVVLKFGGTSVGSIDRIKKVCKIISSYKKKKNKVVVISSAMSGVTNELVNKSKLISNNFDKAEYDTLLSTGEQVSCALIAGRLNHIGFKSRSWLSWQIPIITEGPYSAARINNVVSKELQGYLKSGGIPVITGFQGINNNYRLTTIGRSGSDATAIMLAKFIKADECIIYTDVDGVYTTDPRQYKNAKKIKKIFYDEMLEMASLGSKVMQPTSVQDAKLNKIDIKVKSSFVSKPGTLITNSSKAFSDQIITGIDASSKNISIAKLHAKKNKLKINYICSSPEKLKIQKKFDVILNMEIVEHVEDINFFINSCSKLLKKNGIMFVATLNKTLKSYMFAIVVAEYVLRWLPIGTHDWEKFVRPEDLKKILSKNNLKLEKLDGMNFNIIKDEWSVSSDTSINYIVKSVKL